MGLAQSTGSTPAWSGWADWRPNRPYPLFFFWGGPGPAFWARSSPGLHGCWATMVAGVIPSVVGVVPDFYLLENMLEKKTF